MALKKAPSPASGLTISELPGPLGPVNANEAYSLETKPSTAFGSEAKSSSKVSSVTVSYTHLTLPTSDLV